MYNKSRIAILMTTYNGECYLNYQIESIMGSLLRTRNYT